MNNALNMLHAAALAHGIAERRFRSVDIVESCLERIARREPTVNAWYHCDPDQALAQAQQCDAEPPRSPLHGIPIGLKDIIDTCDMPTTYGSRAFIDHHLEQDAACVARLRNAGAVIMGKTVTTEFAYYGPGPTTNPHHPDHTPGGSSSGSAAAVADFHVPLALGTQTAGSIIRPASFNGVVGYKPTFDTYPMDGVLPVAPSLDTLGVFARDVDDLRLCNRVLAIDATLTNTIDAPAPRRIAVVRGPHWESASDAIKRAFDAFVAKLRNHGIDCDDEEPAEIETLFANHLELMATEAVPSLEPFVEQFGDLITPQTADLVAQGKAIDDSFPTRRVAALDAAESMLERLFGPHDAALALSAPGAAPAGLQATGDPMFNRIWTYCGVPCINLPIGCDTAGLPLGAQLIAARSTDANLIAMAEHLLPLTDFTIELPAGQSS